MLNECFCDFASFKIPRLELNWSSWDLMWLKFRCLSHIRIQEEDKQKLDQSRGNYNQITQLILYCLVLQWDYTCNIQGVSLKWQQVNWTSSQSSLKWSYLWFVSFEAAKLQDALHLKPRSLSDCQSITLNVMIQVSQFVMNSQLCY